MKFWYIQELHVFPDEFLVMVGYNHAEAIRLMKRIHVKKHLIDYMETSENVQKTFEFSDGACFGSQGVRVLWMRSWKPDLEHYSRIVHETSHLRDFILIEGRNMMGETEALAYAQEYMFRQLVSKLNKQYEKQKTRQQAKRANSSRKTRSTGKRGKHSDSSSRRKKQRG